MKTTAEVIAGIVAAAPPLTDEQRSRLAMLLQPTEAARHQAEDRSRRAAA